MPNKPTEIAVRVKLALYNKYSYTYGGKQSSIYSSRILNRKESKETYAFKNNYLKSTDDTKEPYRPQREPRKQNDKDQSASVKKIQVPNNHHSKESIVTHSTSALHIEKDPIINFGREKDDAPKNMNKKQSNQDFKNLAETHSSFNKGDLMRWYKDSRKTYLYRKVERQTGMLDDHNGGASKKDFRNYKYSNAMEKYDRMSKGWHSLDLDSYSKANTKADQAYEQMRIINEITYRTLLRRIKMESDKASRDPYDLYKLLNKQFKRPNTEDFFKDLVSSVVDVLENLSLWIAETLSLPLPDPVDHDKLIYMKADGFNYSSFVDSILNDRLNFHFYPGNNSESNGYMVLHQ